MAILEMKKLSLAVVRPQKEALLKELQRLGCVEVTEIAGTADEETPELRREVTDILRYRDAALVLQRGLDILNRYIPEKSGLLSSKKTVEAARLLDDTGMWGCVKFAENIGSNEDRIARITAEESRLKGTVESLRPWLPLNIALNTPGTEYAAVLIGTVSARFALPDIARAIEDATEEAQLYSVSSDRSQHYVMVICLREKLADVQETLRGFGFTPSAVTGMEGSARELTGRAEVELKSLASEKAGCVEAIKAENVRRDEMKLAHDRMTARIAAAEAGGKLLGSDSAVYLEGWIPAEKEVELTEVLSGFACAWETVSPTEEEYGSVPVQLKNNRITDGLNMVTNMYSLPKYGTVDPNPLMAPFFILFFGLMMADMGYGVLMVIAALIALAKIKPEGGTLSFCRLLLWGGISTFAMGILTGGLFSDAPKQLYDLICESRGIEPVWQGLPKLFSPTEDSITVLIGALVLGWAHLNAGMVVSFVRKWKSGDKSAAIWEEGALWVLLLGIAVFALKKTGIAAWIPEAVAVGALVVGIGFLLFGAGRDAKGFGKVTAAFACIYNTATGWFGDILSYSRIMALMLAGGVIGQVFNTVAIMPAKNGGITPVTIAAFVIIFLLGHAMNFGLNLLGCYVHDLRLQCLEFFGKFYEDGGRPFKPLKLGSRFFRVTGR